MADLSVLNEAAYFLHMTLYMKDYAIIFRTKCRRFQIEIFNNSKSIKKNA